MDNDMNKAFEMYKLAEQAVFEKVEHEIRQTALQGEFNLELLIDTEQTSPFFRTKLIDTLMRGGYHVSVKAESGNPIDTLLISWKDAN
jgi:hypothetical protein